MAKKKQQRRRKNFLMDSTTERDLLAIAKWLTDRLGRKQTQTAALQFLIHRGVRQIIEGKFEI